MWMKIASSHLPKIIFYELQNKFNLRTLKIHSSYFTVRKSYILLILTPFVEAFLEITVIFKKGKIRKDKSISEQVKCWSMENVFI